jgi:integrase/recombinase XerD
MQHFNQTLLEHHLKLKNLEDKTIQLYVNGVRRATGHFNSDLTDLTRNGFAEYFAQLATIRSQSTLHVEECGLKFYFKEILQQPWPGEGVFKRKPSKTIPNIVSHQELQLILRATQKASYRVLFFVLYSLGLRLGEGLRLEVGDLDAQRMRVHIRESKQSKDRFVPLPNQTLAVLRRFWAVHRNPRLLFPNRQGGLAQAGSAQTPLDRGGVQRTMALVTQAVGLKKRLPRTAYDIPTQPI